MQFTRATRSLAVSLLVLLSTGSRALMAAPAGEMAAAANNFLASLTPEQKAKASFELKSDEHKNWHFIPKPRNGLPIKEMTPAQRNLALALLNTGLSSRGFTKALSIMSLENVLAELEGPARKNPRDPELYFFSVFGTPGAKTTWGWRTEGHHCSFNFTIVNGDEISSTPSFMGTNPAKVPGGPRQGLRVLAAEEDIGRELAKSLTDDQKKTGIFITEADKVPKDIITMAEKKVKALDTIGISADKLSKEQNARLLALIREYVFRTRGDLATKELAKIEKAGFDKITFGWAGPLEPGQGHYYRVQGPTFLLEYDCTQNNANHIHAVWRDFDNDFGDASLAHFDPVK